MSNNSNQTVLPYPTMDDLFGAMDYCACEDCRSALSPAAYLVDLLQLIELKKYNPDGSPIQISFDKSNPIEVLLRRRPDIEHLELTCENTNTILPYIDLVNEILEYFVANKSLNNFDGYNVEDVTSEELLANPQFVNDKAYDTLKAQVYPISLPFNRPLEALRLCYTYFNVKLSDAMQKLRINEKMDVKVGIDKQLYGWRDIYNESLGISQDEYLALVDSKTNKLPVYFGEDKDLEFNKLNAKLLNVETFCKKVDIRYVDLIAVIQTEFVNLNSYLIPKLEALKVNDSSITFSDIKNLKDGKMSENDFLKKIPPDLVNSPLYGGDVKKWIKDNYDDIMNLILLALPDGATDCEFDKAELRYALPDNTLNTIKEIDYWRLVRFIRLWKKLGWSIDETDKIITAFYKSDYAILASDDLLTQKQKLDDGFKDLLLKIACLKKVIEKLNLQETDLVRTLTIWSDIDTHGDSSLYQQMFLVSTKIDKVFDDNGYGEYLQDGKKVSDYLTSIQAALNVTSDDLFLILQDAGLVDALLSLDNVSKIYRYVFLCRTLDLSMREFISFKSISQLDPFAALTMVDQDGNAIYPSILEFIDKSQLVKNSDFGIETLGYLLLNDNADRKFLPSLASVLSLAKTLKDGITRIENEHDSGSVATEEFVKSQMSLVYNNSTVDTFFGLLNGTTTYSTSYGRANKVGDFVASLTNVSKKISYDDFGKTLSYQGVMTDSEKDALEKIDSAADYVKAIDTLFKTGQDQFKTFYLQYPELKKIYVDNINSDPNKRLQNILQEFLPSLKDKLKRLFIKQTLCTALNVQLDIINDLLENQDALHSIDSKNEEAISDYLNLEESGAYEKFYFSGDTSKNPDKEGSNSDGINYSDGNKLPSNPADATAKISAVWEFYLEVPSNGSYNLYVETDKDSQVKISIDDTNIQTSTDAPTNTWTNKQDIDLKVGSLYKVRLEVDNVASKVVALKWASKGMGIEIIPPSFMYPAKIIQNYNSAYLRLLKALNIFVKLGLNEKEISFFSANLQLGNEGFLNAIPVKQNPDKSIVKSLLWELTVLLHYNEIKISLKITDESLVNILNDPASVDENGDNILLKTMGWDKSSLDFVLKQYGLNMTHISDMNNFRRILDVFSVITNFGVSPDKLFGWTTNQPSSQLVREVINTLRAKYDITTWLNTLQQINDKLRGMQRNALVSYILAQMQNNSQTQDIDTPNKLLEYFLIDVENDPCTKTSRIKQVISTVQLFIYRCLMNLELDVSPSSIKVNQWQWMSRYRVWEANRRIFLYPENWLEPEFRDNKSPFFKDMEGELLQADITPDLAETALLNYLGQLDTVSKLEIACMYVQTVKLGSKNDDIVHVLGRTNGASRKYYYRRLEYGNWTPWEKVDLDIEDNPIIPVFWKGNLFLFWLNVVKKGSDKPPLPSSNDSGKASDLITIDDLNKAGKSSVEINLSWSEYFNNKWQPRKTSDIGDPMKIDPIPSDFVRNDLQMRTQINGEKLYIIVGNDKNSNSFLMYNKHSNPKRLDIVPPFVGPAILWYPTYSLNGDFAIKYEPSGVYVTDLGFNQHVLGAAPNEDFSIVLDSNYSSTHFDTLYFLQDQKYVFFVKQEMSLLPIHKFKYFGPYPDLGKYTKIQFPKIWIKPDIETNMLDLNHVVVKSPATKTQVTNPGVGGNELAMSKTVLGNQVIAFGGVKINDVGSNFFAKLSQNVANNPKTSQRRSG